MIVILHLKVCHRPVNFIDIVWFFPARLRKPQDGLFTGVVDALDTVSNSYRITFDRPGLGTHSIPDYEVLVSFIK